MSKTTDTLCLDDDKPYEDYESVISYDNESEEHEVFMQSLSQAADVDCSDEIEYCVLDFETSGFAPSIGARVIEIGAAKVKDKCIMDTFTTLCCPTPGYKFSKKITEVTSITPSMLHDKEIPSTHQAMEKLAEFIGDRIVIAHNASFDWRFLVAEFQRSEIPVPAHLPVCSLILSKRLLPKQSSYRLENLAKLIDFTPPPTCDYHRAMTDVYATIDLWFHLQDLAQESREELIKAGEIKPPKQKEQNRKEFTKRHKSTVPYLSDTNESTTTEQVVSGGGSQVFTAAEEKARAIEYKNIHFPPKATITPYPLKSPKKDVPLTTKFFGSSSENRVFTFYDSPPIVPVFPAGNLLIARNVVVKKTEPWRDSYELFQFTNKNFEEVVSEHPRKLARSTIFNHILDAFKQGEVVDLLRLAEGTKETYPVPTSDECRMFTDTLNRMGVDPTVDNGWFLGPVLQKVRPTEDKLVKQEYYSKLKWYQIIMYHGIFVDESTSIMGDDVGSSSYKL